LVAREASERDEERLSCGKCGVTTLEIPKAELPPGKELTFAARPLSSLGTAGKAIKANCNIS
jgi:hypothetical protein